MFIRFLVFVTILGACSASYCTGEPSVKGNKPNLYPITTPAINHVRDWRNGTSTGASNGGGRLFEAAHPEANQTFPVLHLYGTPYEMGYAHGVLLKDTAVAQYDAFYGFLVAAAGGEANLEAMIVPVQRASAPYVSARTTDELRGLADATGYNYTRVLWMHLFPETAGGHCSMFGAWGSATQNSYGGKTLQMRALDYMTQDFLSDYHALLVYHPADGEGHAFVNVGFAGMVTLVTGMNAAPVALSQIGVSNPDSTFGPQKNGQGIPFIFLLRDLLQFGGTLPDVEAALRKAHRTIDLILGFGVPFDNDKGGDAPFTGVQYAADQVRFYDDTNMLPVNASWHPKIQDVVYHGMDWDCPGWTKPLGEKLAQYHGNLTAALTVREINARVQTGNLHVAIYEIEQQIMYVSFSAGEKQRALGGPAFAYERPYARVDVGALFAVAL